MKNKWLRIYKKDDDYVIARKNQFGTEFIRYYESEAALQEGLEDYMYVIDEYNIMYDKNVAKVVLRLLK